MYYCTDQLPSSTAEQRPLLVTDLTSRPAGENRDKNVCLFSRRLIMKQNVLYAAGHQMRRKTGQIKHSVYNYASQALGTPRKISHFSEWAQASGQRRGGSKVFPLGAN